MEAENPRAVAGGNNPPSLQEELNERHAKLFALVEPLAQRANAQPQKVTTDDENFNLGEVVKDAKAAINRLEDARVAEKDPFLRSGQTVDATFKAPKDRLTRIIDLLSQRTDAYAHQKKLEARRRQEEEQQRLRDEEDRHRRLAEIENDLGDYEAAETHAAAADAASSHLDHKTTVAAPTTADLTRARSDSGMLATASDKWDFRVPDWSKVDVNALRPFISRETLEKALRAHIRIHKGSIPIAGVEFVEGTKASFR